MHLVRGLLKSTNKQHTLSLERVSGAQERRAAESEDAGRAVREHDFCLWHTFVSPGVPESRVWVRLARLGTQTLRVRVVCPCHPDHLSWSKATACTLETNAFSRSSRRAMLARALAAASAPCSITCGGPVVCVRAASARGPAPLASSRTNS